jgi:hypothetical protein
MNSVRVLGAFSENYVTLRTPGNSDYLEVMTTNRTGGDSVTISLSQLKGALKDLFPAVSDEPSFVVIDAEFRELRRRVTSLEEKAEDSRVDFHEGDIVDHNIRLNDLSIDMEALRMRVRSLEANVADHEDRIVMAGMLLTGERE